MAFYFGELVALAVCWMFYCEFRWVLERKMHKVCSNEFISKRCITFSDKLFFTPVSGKVNFGLLYYLNIIFFFIILMLSCFHVVFGWIGGLQHIIKVVTTAAVLVLGFIGAASSAGSSDEICSDQNIVDPKHIRIIQILVFVSEVIVILSYLYLTWVFIA